MVTKHEFLICLKQGTIKEINAKYKLTTTKWIIKNENLIFKFNGTFNLKE